MIEWYKKVVFENYANFKGRARRSEYWYFTLMNTIITIVLSMFDKFLGLKIGNSDSGILNTVYGLAVFLPGIAVSVRRLHDIGKSGKLLLLFYVVAIVLAVIMVGSGMSMFMSGGSSSGGLGFFIPLILIIGIAIWLIILFCTAGDVGPNNYGPDPKSDGSESIDEIGVE